MLKSDTAMEDKLMIGVGVNAFILQDGKTLWLRRKGKIGNGKLCLPGGHLESGESMAEGMAREVREEVGVVVVEYKLAHIINDPTAGHHFMHVNFVVSKWEGSPEIMELDKCSELLWINSNVVPENVFVGHQHFVPTLRRGSKIVDLNRESSGDSSL